MLGERKPNNPKQTNTVQNGHFQISYLYIENAYYTRFKLPTWRLLIAIYIEIPYHDHCRKAKWAQQTASNKEAVDRIVSDHELESAASFVPAALTSVEVPFAPDPKGNIWMDASLEDFDGVTSLVLFNEFFRLRPLVPGFKKVRGGNCRSIQKNL